VAPIHYLALLRGINVGGSNIIKMAHLKQAFEDLGCTDVTTYIQSGNVVFRSGERDAAKLVGRIEEALSARFGYESRVVLLTQKHLAQVVAGAPPGYGTEPAKYRYDVVFLKEPLTAAEAMKSVSLKEGVDTADKGKGVVYYSRLISRITQTRLTRIIGTPVYQYMTLRNWNTTTKLLALMEKT
jgi:uncharacterized protein (DUF1697 family)